MVSRFTRTESSLDSETCSQGQVTSGPCITRYSRGVRTGPVWISLLGGGWLHGVPDQRGEMTGHQIMFIYPDLTTVLCGSFTKGVMVRAVQATLADVGKYLQHFFNLSHQSIPVPQISRELFLLGGPALRWEEVCITATARPPSSPCQSPRSSQILTRGAAWRFGGPLFQVSISFITALTLTGPLPPAVVIRCKQTMKIFGG